MVNHHQTSGVIAMKLLFSLVAIATLTYGCAAMATDYDGAAPVKTHETSAGTVLTTPSGMTLYTFDKDQPGVSHCTDHCAQNWPPFAADASAQAYDEFSLIKRDDGSVQWAYDEKPLYTFVGDKKPGDAKGNGLGNAWHTVPAQGEDQAGGSNPEKDEYGSSSRW